MATHSVGVRALETLRSTSHLTGGLAIELLENSSLESILHEDAPGPGGVIAITSWGGSINANGNVEADRGTITISNVFSWHRSTPADHLIFL